MDVTCAYCGEPWDTYHLRHDEVHETPAGERWMDYKLDCEDHEKELLKLSPAMRKGFKGPAEPDIEKWEGKLTDFWREEFAKGGWKFGTTVTVVLRCPACKEKETPLRDKLEQEDREARRRIIGELLEGDDDGIDAELEDLAIKERFGP